MIVIELWNGRDDNHQINHDGEKGPKFLAIRARHQPNGILMRDQEGKFLLPYVLENDGTVFLSVKYEGRYYENVLFRKMNETETGFTKWQERKE